MTNTTFLDKLASQILNDYSDNLSNVTIILPNKRAKVFLISALASKIDNNVFAPSITNIEDFIQDLAGLRAIDPIEVLFEFYKLYQQIVPVVKQQSFDIFANWAKILLQDFNEIDRYLLDARHILSYIKDIEDIKKWGVEVEQKTPLLENYVDFWKMLPVYYDALQNHLIDKKTGYQGLIYRKAVSNIESNTFLVSVKRYVFAGFNALNPAEEKIVQFLMHKNIAKIYWDADQTFLNDRYHDAGLFLRQFKSKWKHYNNNPFEWIVNEFASQKNIYIIGTPKTVGQASVAGKIVEEIIEQKNAVATNLEKVAIVLGDESLLIPVLYALPSNVGSLNITMGYSGKNNPAQTLVAQLFKLHNNAIKRNQKNYVFYYIDVLDVLTHPLVAPYVGAHNLVKKINEFNITFVTHIKLFDLQTSANDLFCLLFTKWDAGPSHVLTNLSNLLIYIKNTLGNANQQDQIAKTFIYSIFKTINKLSNYCADNPFITSIDNLFAIYKQVIDLAEVSFEGEPLNGLQIMGVLESRVLDFETVIITSMNEGCFPAGKSGNSFIPYDVKAENGLPTFKEKDAIYTYHFYHLLQRAKKIYLIYNTESGGLDGGEKSRFITQLEVEKQPMHQIKHDIYNADLPQIARLPVEIYKTDSVLHRLKEIAEAGFSPSSLTAYIRNPIGFYFDRILKIRQLEEVEESLAVNTLGTIIHKALEVLYLPLINKPQTVSDLKNCINQIDAEVLTQFKSIYKEGEIKKGRNLLYFEIAKRNLFNFFKNEITNIENGDDIKILHLEHPLEWIVDNPKLPYAVKIKGTVDRIEIRNGKLRIIDYKTGKVESRNLTLSSWDNLTENIDNEKIIQILCYALMLQNQLIQYPVEAGIISFKNLKTGFLPFGFKTEKTVDTTIDNNVLVLFTEQIVNLLTAILDKNQSFSEKK